jgi:hypothetical protein
VSLWSISNNISLSLFSEEILGVLSRFFLQKIQTKWLIEIYVAKRFEVKESKQNKMTNRELWKKHVVSNWSDRKVYKTDSIQFVMQILKL